MEKWTKLVEPLLYRGLQQLSEPKKTKKKKKYDLIVLLNLASHIYKYKGSNYITTCGRALTQNLDENIIPRARCVKCVTTYKARMV